MIKFSVIIPVYNSEKYIGRCLHSISSQLYSDIQVIVVDDGSTDSSRKIITRYVNKDNRFKYIYKENGGPATARNMGIAYSTGEYICFIDSDDEILDNYFYEINKALKNNNLDILEINACYKNIHGKLKTYQEINIDSKKRTGIEYLCDYLAQRKYFNVAPWTKIMNRQFIINNDLYFKNRFAEDELWAHKCFVVASNVMFLNKAIYKEHRRVNSQSDKKSQLDNVMDQKDNFYELEKFYIKNVSNPKQLNILRSELCHQFIAVSLLNNDAYISYKDKRFSLSNAKNMFEFINAILFCIAPKFRRFIKNGKK